MFPGMPNLPPRAGMRSLESLTPESLAKQGGSGHDYDPSGMVPDEIEEIETPEIEIEEVEEAVGDVDISPEAVCFRGSDMVCGNCRYMQATGDCVPLKMPVGPGDGCNLFADRGGM